MALCGWHVLKQWSSDYFNFNVLLQDLQVKYGVSPYFKITTVPNSREPGNSSIMILPSGLGLPDKSYYYMEDDKYEKAYEGLIKDVILQLSQTVTEAERFARNIFSYEKRLAEIMPDSAELLDPIKTDNTVKVSELKTLLQNIELDDIITAMYPEANINEETEVLVAQHEYLTKLTQVISSTDAVTKNVYMIWTLVREYIPYLSSNFRDAIEIYRTEVYGVQKPIERWEFCSNLVQRFMPIAIDAIIEKQSPIKDAKLVVNEMFTNIVASVKQHLQKYKANTDLYSKLEKKLGSLKLQVGLPDSAYNDTLIRNYYIKLNIIRSNLFENYKRAISFVKKLEDHKLRQGSVDDYIMNAATKKPASVLYIPSSNTVVVPRALLASPYFESGYSKSINYGRLGHDIAKAVVSSVLPFDSAWTADSKLLSKYHLSVNESLRLVRYPTFCLSDFISKRHYVPAPFANLTDLNTLKYLSALNIAHDSLKTSLENKEHIHLPTLEIYEDSALFYLANMQELCTISTKEQDLYDTLVNYKLPEKYMFKVNLHQSFGLWDSLKCSYSDKYECSDIF